MRLTLLVRLCTCAIGLILLNCAPPGPACSGRESPAAPPDASPRAVSAALMQLTNSERARAGLVPLRANARLMQAAQLHADQMAGARRLEHVLPAGAYPRPEDRLATVGYAWQAWAENLALGEPDASRALAGWMRSAGHRANILSAAYTELGTGHAVDAAGRPYYVQVFGRPTQ
jgi:uncharacterized protein YkwD